MDIEILKEFVFLSRGFNVTKASSRAQYGAVDFEQHIIKLERDLGCSLVGKGWQSSLDACGS